MKTNVVYVCVNKAAYLGSQVSSMAVELLGVNPTAGLIKQIDCICALSPYVPQGKVHTRAYL